MGSHRLRPIYPSKFAAWVKVMGFADEMEFWSSISGLDQGTLVDHMVFYLSSLGYSGTPSDMFRSFLRDQTGKVGTIFDMGNQLFDAGGAAAGGIGANDRITTDGSARTTTDGDTRTTI